MRTALFVMLGLVAIAAQSASASLVRIDFTGTFHTPASLTPGVNGTPLPGVALSNTTPFSGSIVYDSSSSPDAGATSLTAAYPHSLRSFSVTFSPSDGDVTVQADQLEGVLSFELFPGFSIDNPLGQVITANPTADGASSERFDSSAAIVGDGSQPPVFLSLFLGTAAGTSEIGMATPLPEALDASVFLGGHSAFQIAVNGSNLGVGGLESASFTVIPAPSALFAAGLGALVRRRRRG